jgi:diguanylate cyclase (GGDEF)-like protein/PAS domain S-box-containing protein
MGLPASRPRPAGHRTRSVESALDELTSGTGDLRAALEYVRDLEDRAGFYPAIHAVVGRLMPARNFAVLLRDSAGLRYAYRVDESDTDRPGERAHLGVPEYVVRSERALLATPATVDLLVAQGEIAPLDVAISGCIGTPIFVGGEAVGALVVRSYARGIQYTPEHLEVLIVVARFVGEVVAALWATDSLPESEARFRTLAETAPCSIVIFDGDRLRYANSAARLLTAHPDEDPRDQSFWDIVHPDFRETVQNHAAARLAGRPAPARFAFPLVPTAAGEQWLDFSLGLITHRGRAALLGVGVDVTEQKRAEQRMYTLAYLDTLTGLPNRMLFQDRIGVALADHRRLRKLALLFLDIDGFKQVNDSLGHAAGDELLKGVSHRIRSTLRDGDTVARMGGDEFVVLLTGLESGGEAATVGRKVLDALKTKVRIGDHELHVHASMGIAIYPEDGADAGALLKNADEAMYRAKEAGGDTYQLHSKALHDASLERIKLECDLRRALAEGEMVLHYQPIYDLRERRFHGFEALVRWQHPERGLLLPVDFLAALERARLMATLGRWVLGAACAQARAWRHLRVPRLNMAVNVGPGQFQEATFLDEVRQALADHDLDPSELELEITETEAMGDPVAAGHMVTALNALGVQVSIDDFGTGYSSLAYLKDLPIQVLKIDRCFVQDITKGSSDAAIANAIIGLGHNLDLSVLAEGVETEEQLAFLRTAGCDRIQGFFFSPPLPAEECPEFLVRYGGAVV